MPRHPMTVEDIWKIPRVGAPVPSPDGTRFVVSVTQWSMETNEAATRLWLCDADGKAEPRALTHAEASSGQASWSPDGKRLLFVRKPGGKADEKKKSGPKFPDQPQLFLMPLDGGEPERLTDLPFGAADARWFPDGKRIAFLSSVYAEKPAIKDVEKRKKEREDDPCKVHVTEDRVFRYWDHWLTDGRVHHLFAMDLESREITDLTPKWDRWFSPEDPFGQYRISPDGREIAFGACASDPPHDPWLWSVFTVDTAGHGRVRKVASKEFRDTSAPQYSPDGKWLVYGMQREIDFYADKSRLVAMNRATGKHTVLTENWDRSASGWGFSADSKTIYVRAEDRARTTLYALDLAAALHSPKYQPRPLVRQNSFSGPEIAGGRAFVSISSVFSPPEAAVIDLRSKKLRRATRFTEPVMKTVELCEVEETHITGAGGHPVQMWIFYPPGKKKTSVKRAPLVHMIHGGPHGAFGDEWHWRWNAHAFAAPGYVVAMVNFHGSTGWGQDFTASILGRWGDQPYFDITVATDMLIARGLIDPKRMAATGGSYGGYMAAWIASQTDRYACIVNHAGVSDLQTQYGSDVTQGRPRSMGGEPWDKVERMDRWNPMRFARGFKSPMLVVHGQKDYRVPYGQGLEIYNVYKAMKLPARLVIYPEENHWILKPRTSRHWYGEVLGWLKRWLKKGARR